jgi:hypothetical protein
MLTAKNEMKWEKEKNISYNPNSRTILTREILKRRKEITE